MSIEAMKQALEALEYFSDTSPTMAGKAHAEDAITTLRTAIEQAEKAEPVAIDSLPRACNLAGVDYQTYLKIKAYMPVTPTAPVQEPVAITDAMAFAFHRALSDGAIGESEVEEIKAGLAAAFAHITTPPAAPVQDQGQSCYCPNCEVLSKQLAAQPAPVQEPVAWGVHDQIALNKVIAAPPAAQRQWVGLTDAERGKLILDNVENVTVAEAAMFKTVAHAIEAKLREKNGGAA